jgi:hypothetical protein
MPDGRGSEESTIFVAGLPSDMTNLEMPLDFIGKSANPWGFFRKILHFLYPNVPYMGMIMLYDYGYIYIYMCVCIYMGWEICEIYGNLRCLHFGCMIMVEIMVID